MSQKSEREYGLDRQQSLLRSVRPPRVPPPRPSHPNLWKIQATQSESQSVGTLPVCIKGKALKAQLWFISAHTLGRASAGLTGGDFTWTFFPLKNDEWKQLYFEKGFSSRRDYASGGLGHNMVLVLRGTPHSTTSRCPGEEKKSQDRVGRERGGVRGQVQSLKDLIATLTSSRSKESLLGLWSLDNRV